MSTILSTNHPPDTQQLDAERIELALPQLRLHERLALRIAVRALLRVERLAVDRERAARVHEHLRRVREVAVDHERRTLTATGAYHQMRRLL